MDRQRIRPPYPALAASSSSASSSIYNSSSSLASLPCPGAMPNDEQSIAVATLAQQSAPLPSPTAEEKPFFGSLGGWASAHQQAPAVSHQQQQVASTAAARAQTQTEATAPQQQGGQERQSASFDYGSDRPGLGPTNPETTRLLRESNLLAEAAKRAQVACVIRDLDDMDMS